MSYQDELARTAREIADLDARRKRLIEHGEQVWLKGVGLEVGDRIIVTVGREEYPAIVTGARWAGRGSFVDVLAAKCKKDGTVSKRSACFDKWWKA